MCTEGFSHSKRSLLFVAFFGVGLLGVCGMVTPVAAISCSVGEAVDRTLPNGSRWEMCARSDASAGVVLSDVTFTAAGPNALARRVLQEASVAQIHLAFDDGRSRHHFVTDYGLGGANLHGLVASDCAGGTLRSLSGQNVLCEAIRPRGYAWKYYSQVLQGDLLELYSVSQVLGYTWVVQWRFHDDGTIQPRIGATGELQEFGSEQQFGWSLDVGGTIGVSSSVNYYWRLDFGIGADASDDKVEEFNVLPTSSGSKHELVRTQLTTEQGRQASSDSKRSWRVYDGTTNLEGHEVSYHLEPLHTGHRYIGPSSEPWSVNELWVTVSSACERFVSNNDVAGGCGTDVTDFVDGESIDGNDLVLWYGLSYHHLPRDESEPYMPTRWDGFELLPRDWTHDNPMALLPPLLPALLLQEGAGVLIATSVQREESS